MYEPTMHEIAETAKRLAAADVWSASREPEDQVAYAMGFARDAMDALRLGVDLMAGPLIEATVGPLTGPMIEWQANLCGVEVDDAGAMAATAACMIHALAQVATQDCVRVRLVLVGEPDGMTAEHIFADYARAARHPDFLISGEPTGGKIALATRGRLLVSHRADGHSVAATRASGKDNPVLSTVPFLHRVMQQQQPDGVDVTPTMLHAGLETNAVPAESVGSLDIRYPAGVKPAGVLVPIELAARDEDVELEAVADTPPVALTSANPYVGALVLALADREPFTTAPELASLPPGTIGVRFGLGGGAEVPAESLLRYAETLVHHVRVCGLDLRITPGTAT